MTAKWSHLPNARHIDAVLAHLKQHLEQWDDAGSGAIAYRQFIWPGLDSAWSATLSAGRDSAWRGGREAVWQNPHYNHHLLGQLAPAWKAIAALIAWDNSSSLLSLPLDQVELLASLGHHPAVLLLPAAYAMSIETA